MAIYYVDGVNGNDSNAGTSPSAAVKTIAYGLSLMGDGDSLYIMNTGTYVLTTSLAVTLAATAANGGALITGANASGVVDGTKATITSSTNGVSIFTMAGCSYIKFRYLDITHTAATRGIGIQGITTASTNCTMSECIIDGCLDGVNNAVRQALVVLTKSTIQNCTGIGCNGSQILIVLEDVVLDKNTSHGFSSGGNSISGATFTRCRITRNGGNGIYDSGTTRSNSYNIEGCTIANNVGDGINSASSTGVFAIQGNNNLLYGNAYNINCPSLTTNKTKAGSSWDYAAVGGSASGNYNNFPTGIHDIPLSADPFTSASTGDFSLNNNTGGGAACKAAAYQSNGVAALDIGALQSVTSGGGGGGANLLGAGTLVA